MTTEAELAAFLRDGASQPFAWGVCDCCLWATGWVAERTGIDPAPDLRGAYATELGAARHVAREGGFLEMWRMRMARAGFAETDDPQMGDVGVVRLSSGLTAAVRTRIGWATKGQAGIVVTPGVAAVAWRVEQCAVQARAPDCPEHVRRRDAPRSMRAFFPKLGGFCKF